MRQALNRKTKIREKQPCRLDLLLMTEYNKQVVY